jgi:hypothetical protein
MTILELEKIENDLKRIYAELDACEAIIPNQSYLNFITTLMKQINDKQCEIYTLKQQTQIDYKI